MAVVGTVTVSLRRSTTCEVLTLAAEPCAARETGPPVGGSAMRYQLSLPRCERCAVHGSRCDEPRPERLDAPVEHLLAALTFANTLALGDVWHQSPVGVHRLEAIGVGAREVPHQTAKHALLGRYYLRQPQYLPGGVGTGQPPGGGRLEVALRTGQHAGCVEAGQVLERHGRFEQARSVEVGVAVHDAVAHHLGLLEPGDQLDYLLLIAPLETGLEADQRPHAPGSVFLSQLHDRVRPPSRARVIESYRLERAEARSVAPAARQLLDRHTALEELELLPLVWRVVPSLCQRVVEAIVLLLGEWQVEVVGSLVIAPRPERDVHVDAVVRDYRRCCVVEPQELFTDDRAYRS